MSFPVPDPETGLELPTEDETQDHRKRNLVIGGGILVSLAIIATISGVCGSGKCSKRDIPSSPPETTIVAVTTPVAQASEVPSMPPSDFPSLQPSDWPSQAPSDTPSIVPTRNPTRSPSLRPTAVPTTVPTTVPTVPPRIIASAEEESDSCGFTGCFLRNLDDNVEVPLALGQATSYIVSSFPYSIRCDFENTVESVEFAVGDYVHREFNAPYWMESNDSVWIEPADVLQSCEPSVLRVVASSDDIDEGTVCWEGSFRLEPQCDEPSPAPPVVSPTTNEGTVVAASLEEEEVVESVDASSSCGPDHIQCYLRNLDSGSEIRLEETKTNVYRVETDDDYSIHCTAVDTITYMEFSWDETTHREHNAPYWMNSNSADWIEPVDSLSKCGSSHDIQVETVGDAGSCFVSLALVATC